MSNTVWFTSDTHYGHLNIVGPTVSKWDDGYRDFENLSIMNDAIVDSINAKVKTNDTLYHLGDFAFKKEDINIFRERINCKNIHLIYGNHDKHIIKSKEYQKLFTTCSYYKEIKVDIHNIVLMHYAMRVWNKSHYGSYHLYGHSHGKLGDDNSLSMDVGWDIWKAPLNLKNILRYSVPIKPIHLDIERYNYK